MREEIKRKWNGWRKVMEKRRLEGKAGGGEEGFKT